MEITLNPRHKRVEKHSVHFRGTLDFVSFDIKLSEAIASEMISAMQQLGLDTTGFTAYENIISIDMSTANNIGLSYDTDEKTEYKYVTITWYEVVLDRIDINDGLLFNRRFRNRRSNIKV